MSVIKVNNITNRTGISGPTVAGIASVSSSSHLVLPSGRTGQRYADDGENIVRDGLVLYLDAKHSYPGTNGIGMTTTNPDVYTWYDMSGNENHTEILKIGPTYLSDSNGCFYFDAVDDYLDTSFPITSMSSNFSFEVMINISSGQVSGTGNQWGTIWNTNPRSSVFLGPNISIDKQGNSNGPFRIYLNSTYQYTTDLNANTWYSITYVRDSSNNVEMYINGISNGQKFIDTTNHATVIRFMKSNGTEPSYPYSTLGKLSIVRIYNRALTASEVLQNYNATKSRFGL